MLPSMSVLCVFSIFEGRDIGKASSRSELESQAAWFPIWNSIRSDQSQVDVGAEESVASHVLFTLLLPSAFSTIPQLPREKGGVTKHANLPPKHQAIPW